MGNVLSAAGAPGLLKLCGPWLEYIDPGTALEPGLRCAVDAPAFIHHLLQRHRPEALLHGGWAAFDKDVGLPLNRLRRNSTGGSLGVVFDGVRLDGKQANASRCVWVGVCLACARGRACA